MAGSFSHPVYGTVSKAVATIRTGKNANLVEIYVLALGADGVPVAPSAGLKLGLKTYYEDLNVLTDTVAILDGSLYSVDIELVVVVNKNSDATVVKEKVVAAITEHFNVDNWEMGQAFYISNFIEEMEKIDGIQHVDLLSPTNNVLSTGKLSAEDSSGVGIDEVIIEGLRKVSYYYAKK